MTQEIPHSFEEGQKSDLDNSIKGSKGYVLGEHARLHSIDGTLALVSVEGTKEIYNNNKIVRYLGAASFKDQLIVFAKCSGVDVNFGGVIYVPVVKTIIFADNLEVELISGSFSFTNELTSNSVVTTYTENIAQPAPPEEIDINDNYAPEDGSSGAIDFDSYYTLNVNVPIFGTCPVTEQTIPVNNENFADCIISIQKDSNGDFYDKILWSGYQNWPLYGKIVALGVDENSNYRRVKYTDYINPFRSVNVFDPSLYKRSSKELDNFQSTILLQPRISAVNKNGQLKSMAVQYMYRLITENGQVTEFSAPSEVQYIIPEEGYKFQGGSVSEVTNKSVKIQCNVMDPGNFSEIECIALEFEAANVPTSIKSLGIKQASAVVEFDHYGSETEFAGNITLADITEIKTNWKYCSDLEPKNNKLFASGLRNDPITSRFNELRNNFALHGWENNGQTHETFINPNPSNYQYFPPNLTEKLFYAKKRVIRSVHIFQNATMDFVNLDTGNKFTANIGLLAEEYKDYTEEISLWLLNLQANDGNFSSFFPNLEIEYVSNAILFKPLVGATSTDMSNYQLQFNNTQVIQDIDDENIFFTQNLSGQQYIHGGMSAGFNNGTGVRISYRMVEEELATQAALRFTGTGPLIDYVEPNFKKTFIKDEIYRLSIQLYKEGQRLFAIPLGDLHIPEMGNAYSYIDDAGNIVVSSEKYVSQKTIGNKLYGVRVEMRVEVRFDCQFSKDIDMYQILYVERDEANRSILCQGMAAPLIRLQRPEEFLGGRALNEKLQSKWHLPYSGGPTYDKIGLDVYDAQGGEYENDNYDHSKRTIHDRSLMYFDSPDLIYRSISDAFINSSEIRLLGRLNTDHGPDTVMESGEAGMDALFGEESYPKFSRKILTSQLNTLPDLNDWPKLSGDENADNSTWLSHFVNVSVFSNFSLYLRTHQIDGSISLLPGQVLPGSDLNTSFELSNNTFSLGSMPWWYSEEVRRMRKEDDQYGFEALPTGNISKGEKTMFIRTNDDLFTSIFIGSSPFSTVNSQIRRGGNSYIIYDTHALINIRRNNGSSIYGGRSEQAYSKNVFIPLSETKPIYKESNAAQVFNMQGDGYVSLYIRTKNTHGDDEIGQMDREINNGRTSTAPNRGDIETSYKVNGAWCYAVVLETMIEPKLNHEYEFYRENSGIDFSLTKDEVLNSAYLQTNDIKKYIPQPFRYKDNPDLSNIVAASQVKRSGEYYDAWSFFLPNEFQELDKDKGAVLNLAKEKNEIFAIQERQTNLLYIDRDVIIPTQGGGAVNVKQGSGKSIDGYKVISKYGTSIRRSVVKNTDFGFTFVDERLKVLIKLDKELNIGTQYHHDFYDRYDKDPIVNAEPFFDEKYKESGITLTTASGDKRSIVYNEVLKVLNGFYPKYSSTLYMKFGSELLAPIEKLITVGPNIIPNSESLHRFNEGDYLNVLGEEVSMKVGFVSGAGPNTVSIFPHLAMILNGVAKVDRIEITTKAGLNRVILPSHKRYSVKEGIHSVPLLNLWSQGIDSDEKKDVRSEWSYFELTFNYNNGNMRKIKSAITYIRKSFH